MRPYLYLALVALLAFAPAVGHAVSAPAAAVAAGPSAELTTVPAATSRKAERLARKEARQTRRELRRELREALRSGAADTDTILLVILAIFIPPLAMFLYEGSITNRFWISLLLTLLGGLPGIIYTIFIIGSGR